MLSPNPQNVINQMNEMASARAQGQTEGITSDGRFWTDARHSNSNIEKFFTGAPLLSDLEREYRAFLRDQGSAREAREYEERMANTAYQRKLNDLVAAGFSPLAAIEGSGSGAAVPTAQVAKSSQQESTNPMGQLFGALIAAIGLMISRGLGSVATAKNALQLEGIRQNNRIALQAVKSNDAMKKASILDQINPRTGERYYRWGFGNK